MFSGGIRLVGIQASPIYQAGNTGSVLVVNLDLSATAYVGGTFDASTAGIQIPPLGSATFDGTENLWAVSPAGQIQLQIIPGGSSWGPSPAQIAEQISLVGINVNITNFEITPSGDASGVTDTSNLVNALLKPGITVQAAPGTFYFLASSPIELSAQRVFGSGSGQTTFQLVTGFSAASLFLLNGPSAQVDNVTILGGPSTTIASNPSITAAIEVSQAGHCKANDLYMQYVNGYGIEATSGASFDADFILSSIVMRNCAGGIHVQGNTSSSFHGEMFLSNIQLQEMGSAANLDALFIEDIEDILISNINVGVVSGTGSTIHVKGNCATVSVVNPDVGGSANAPCVLIEDNAGNTGPSDVKFANGVFQGGSVCLSVTGHASRLKFTSMSFERAQTHGVSVAGSGFDIDFMNCLFNVNGRGASGTNYDLNWQAGPTGKVQNCEFNTSVTSIGVAGVQAVTNWGTNNQAVEFTGNAFNGSNSAGNQFGSNLPQPIRFNKNYNPVGTTSFIQGSSPVTIGATNYDLQVVLEGASGGIVVVYDSNTWSVTNGNLLTLYIPVGKSVQYSYTSAPTVQVYGL